MIVNFIATRNQTKINPEKSVYYIPFQRELRPSLSLLASSLQTMICSLNIHVLLAFHHFISHEPWAINRRISHFNQWGKIYCHHQYHYHYQSIKFGNANANEDIIKCVLKVEEKKDEKRDRLNIVVTHNCLPLHDYDLYLLVQCLWNVKLHFEYLLREQIFYILLQLFKLCTCVPPPLVLLLTLLCDTNDDLADMLYYTSIAS